MTLNTSLDILWLVLALCAVAITFFLCWMMFYVVGFLRKTAQIINRIEATSAAIHDAIQVLRRKTEDLSTYIPLIIKGGAELKNIINKFSGSKKHGPKRRTDEKEK